MWRRTAPDALSDFAFLLPACGGQRIGKKNTMTELMFRKKKAKKKKNKGIKST
jgi:hypothetical protein